MSVGVLLCLSVVVMLSDARVRYGRSFRSFPNDSENYVCEKFDKISAYIRRESSRFGCNDRSDRPDFDDFVVVACLAPSRNVREDRTEPQQPAAETIREAATETLTVDPRALAFTPQQYDVAAQVLGKTWDQSHYLENLSGSETSCSMINTESWLFDHTNNFNRRLGLYIKGQYGYAPNTGSTPNALLEILNNPTFVNALKWAKYLGCSVIPDCINEQNMFVVVCCLYDE